MVDGPYKAMVRGYSNDEVDYVVGPGIDPGNFDTVVDRLNEQHAEIERLRAIVERLPKTADGVPVTPGMAYWFEYMDTPGEFGQLHASEIYNCNGDVVFNTYCYSTREAAEAARKAGG